MKTLQNLEAQIETMFEGSFARLLGGEVSADAIGTQVARAMWDSIKRDDRGNAFAPDQYALTMNPEDVETLLEDAPTLQSDLASGIRAAAEASDLKLAKDPQVMLASDPTLSHNDVRVVVWHSSNPVEFTQAMPRESQTQPGILPQGAFLIVDGGRHFPLDRPVINIGRRLDNQLILDDPRVSRTHAQMRVKTGRYVLFDLGSTSGTIVNGKKVKQHNLRPGDVVTIADVRLVYGEDPDDYPDETPAYTPPFPPKPAGDQPTYTIDWDKPEDDS